MLKFSCEKALLQLAVNTASRTVATKSSIPALEGLLLEGMDVLTLSGYNMQTGIRTRLEADIRELSTMRPPSRISASSRVRMPGSLLCTLSSSSFALSLQHGAGICGEPYHLFGCLSKYP